MNPADKKLQTLTRKYVELGRPECANHFAWPSPSLHPLISGHPLAFGDQSAVRRVNGCTALPHAVDYAW